MSPAPASQIVVGVDGSEQSIAALRFARKLAPVLDATIRAVAAWDDPAEYPAYVPLGRSEYTHAARKELDEALAAAFGEDTPPGLEASVVFGHPVKTLVKASRDAALLVVGSRGHGTFRGLLVGSISSACVAHAHCPVLVVRPPTDAGQQDEPTGRTASDAGSPHSSPPAPMDRDANE